MNKTKNSEVENAENWIFILYSLGYYENSRVFASFKHLQGSFYVSGRTKKLVAMFLLQPAWPQWSKECCKVKNLSTKNTKFSRKCKKRPKLGEIGSNFEAFIVKTDSSKVENDIFTT